MFDDSVTYEKSISAPRADRGPLDLFVLKFKPDDIYFIHLPISSIWGMKSPCAMPMRSPEHPVTNPGGL